MFKIEFDPHDYDRIIRALRHLPRTAKIADEEMQKTCALQYKQMVAFNIMRQKYSFRAHTKLYREWKQKNFPEYPAFWRLHGDVLKSLSAFKWEDGWMGGIPPGATGRDGRSVAFYANRVEHGFIAKGGKPRPARRMFWKTKEDYRKDPKGWQKQGDRALERLAHQWR